MQVLAQRKLELLNAVATVTYFKSLADETGIPYQSLINLYLRDCVASKKKINLAWA